MRKLHNSFLSCSRSLLRAWNYAETAYVCSRMHTMEQPAGPCGLVGAGAPDVCVFRCRLRRQRRMRSAADAWPEAVIRTTR